MKKTIQAEEISTECITHLDQLNTVGCLVLHLNHFFLFFCVDQRSKIWKSLTWQGWFELMVEPISGNNLAIQKIITHIKRLLYQATITKLD